MNRLSAAPPAPTATAVAALRPLRPVLRNVEPTEPPHCLLAPQHYERNYAYPLVVWLHSTGGDEREVRTVMKHVSLRNYVALGVRGPAALSAGHRWPNTADMIFTAEQAILAAVSGAKRRYNVHPERIFLAGYDSAGTMALRIALRHPDRFAGAASINGAFPERHAPLAQLHRARSLKLLIAHCRDSQAYPIDRVCQELTLFHAAGIAINLRQYPCEDELTTQMLHDLDAWLMEQVTGVGASEEPSDAVPSEWN